MRVCGLAVGAGAVLERVIGELEKTSADVRVVPDLFRSRFPASVGVSELDGMPIISLRIVAAQDLRTLGLLGGDGHPYRLPRLLQAFAVLLRQVFLVLVEHREAHHVEVHLDIADLLDLENPSRRDPAPGAQRIEPEIGDGLLGHEVVLSVVSVNKALIAQPRAARNCSEPLSSRVVNVTRVYHCYTSETISSS